MFWNSTTVTVTISDLTLDLLYASAPDILLSGGELTNTLSSIKQYYATVWHELTHAGNYKRVKDIMGYQYANIYWNDVIATEVGHSAATGGQHSHFDFYFHKIYPFLIGYTNILFTRFIVSIFFLSTILA